MNQPRGHQKDKVWRYSANPKPLPPKTKLETTPQQKDDKALLRMPLVPLLPWPFQICRGDSFSWYRDVFVLASRLFDLFLGIEIFFVASRFCILVFGIDIVFF